MGQNVSHGSDKNRELSRSRSNSRNVSVGAGSSEHDSESEKESVGAITPSGSTKKKKNMSLFRHQSETAKRRMDHQLYLLQESPDPNIDLSSCELQEVPPLVFSLCKVLYKEALLLNDNWLPNINNGKMIDLKTIRVLDLHNNELKVLPEDLGDLSNLQVLNVECNRLNKVPDDIKHLKHLQTLNLRSNRLKVFPPSLCGLPCLRMLDISDNNITSLPPQLCNVRTLETLILDVHKMKSPSEDICKNGTEDIMKTLCAECGMEYLPPSNFLLDVLDAPAVSHSGTSTSINKALQEEQSLMNSLQAYSNEMEKRRLERVEMERQLAQSIEEHAQLAALATQQKQNFIQAVTQDQDKIDRELEELSHRKDKERQNLVAYLQQVEDGTNSLIKQMLEMNEKARKAEELLEVIEKERMEAEEWFVVRTEDMQNLRKEEILKNMEIMLKESEAFEKMRVNFTDNKDNVMKQALEEDQIQSHNNVESILYHKEVEQMMLMDVLQKQEQFQKEAFEALQLQKDAKHQRITSQITLIEEELSSLTALEIQRRNLRSEEEMNIIAEKRIALIEVLSQLLSEQEARQVELKKRLEEMEEQKLDEQTDYWLVQYQRLLDRKPQSLIDKEHCLEIAVVTVLQDSSAEDYIPLFARHRISIETLLQITDDDLKQMGVHELGLRKSILRNVEHFNNKKDAKYPEKSKKDSPSPDLYPAPVDNQDKFAGRDDVKFDHPPPTAPATGNLTRQVSVTARGINSECVVCLDKQSEVLFLYCGHVCVCNTCSGPMNECPLCRAQIVQRIKLSSAET